MRDARVAGGGHSAKLSHRAEDTSGAVANAILVTTRRGELCCAHFAKHVRQQYNLEQVLSSNHSILQEFSNAKVVIFEVPPVTRPRFEFRMLQTVEKLRALGLDILICVQPSLRKKSNKALWVSKWNSMPESPFKFGQTCSCQTGGTEQNCHLTCYVGSTRDTKLLPCSAVPTLCVVPQVASNAFGRTVSHILAPWVLHLQGERNDLASDHPQAAAIRPMPGGPSKYPTQLCTILNQLFRQMLRNERN